MYLPLLHTDAMIVAQTPYPPIVLPTDNKSNAIIENPADKPAVIEPISTQQTFPSTVNPSLGPMPIIPDPVEAGDPTGWETPDRTVKPVIRPSTYALAAGDRINVAISTVPEFSGVYQLMVDGRITLPIIGQVDVLGMTEPEAALQIAQRYTDAQVLVKPSITVVLAEMSNLHIAVLGEVIRPGAYIVTPQNGELPKLTEIIGKAGGITQQTDLQNIQIRRPLRNGQQRVIQTSLWKLLTTGDLSQDIAIRDGDTITLPPAPEISLEQTLLIGRSNTTAAEVQVNVLGEVLSPGVMTIPPGTSLNQALLMAGGLSGQAKKKAVELLRLNPNGTITRRKIPLDYDQAIDPDRNPILQNRDVILIDRSIGAKLSDRIGNVLSPINSIFSLFQVFSPFLPKSR